MESSTNDCNQKRDLVQVPTEPYVWHGVPEGRFSLSSLSTYKLPGLQPGNHFIRAVPGTRGISCVNRARTSKQHDGAQVLWKTTDPSMQPKSKEARHHGGQVIFVLRCEKSGESVRTSKVLVPLKSHTWRRWISLCIDLKISIQATTGGKLTLGIAFRKAGSLR